MASDDGGPAGGFRAPKLGRGSQHEIGRALEAIYRDLVKQGVPAQVVGLLHRLDARAERGFASRDRQGTS
jgi:hypothetical protein